MAHGDSFEDAERSFARALKLFIEQVSKKGAWAAVLRECGWEKVRHEYKTFESFLLKIGCHMLDQL